LGPLTCPTVATNCEAHWARIQAVLGIGGDPGTGTPDGGVVTTPDAGSGGGSDGGVVTAPPATGGKSGCSTAAADGLALMTLAALFLRRRKS
jgi:MYXO-CTERM domain-containing protein